MQVYRIAQEAVNNAVKHANASRVNITLKSKKGQCDLMVSDDGRGFEKDTNMNEGLGVRIMRYRAGIIGNSLQIDSEPGKGTSVYCRPAISSSVA